MIQEDAIYSGKIKIDNQKLYEDEIRNLVMNELKKNNIILETDFQIIYDVLDSEISFSVFFKKHIDEKFPPYNEIVNRITKLKEEFYSCDSNDFERRERLLLKMENLLDTYYHSHDINIKDDDINSDESIISISKLKSRLAQNIQNYNDIDIEISNLKRKLSQKLDSNHGVLSQEDIINIESDYLKNISNLNSESVQCLMHIDLIENYLYNFDEKKKENESVDCSILDNIQMEVFPESVLVGDSRMIPLMIKQIVELRLNSRSLPKLIPNNSGFHERTSTNERQDADMLANFTIPFEPIDDSFEEKIFVLEYNGDYYVSSDVLERFNISKTVCLNYKGELYYKISHDVLSKYNLVVETLFSTNVDLDDEQIKKDIVDNASDVIEKKVLDVYQSEDSDEYYILKSVCEDSNIPFSNVVVVDGLEYVLISSDNQKEFSEHFLDYEFNYHPIRVQSILNSSLNDTYDFDSTGETVSYDGVIHKLYDNLVVPSSERPEAVNVKVTRDFIKILQNNEVGFNIICLLGKIKREISKGLLTFLSNNLLSTSRGQEVYERFLERVNALSDKELAIITDSDGNESIVFPSALEVIKK